MNLLDYKRLQKRFESKDTKGTVKIVLFSKKDKTFTVHAEKDSETLLSFLLEQRARGNVGEVHIKSNVILVCIGEINNDIIIKRTDVFRSMGSVYASLKRFDGFEIIFEDSEYTEDAIYSLILSSYSYDFLKKSKDESTFLLQPGKYSKISTIAHVQNIARFLGDTPANLMTPSLFVEYAKSIFEGENVTFEVYDQKYMKENNMNLILSVSQGSIQEPKLLTIKYLGKNNSNIDVGLVGKGVCFDSGGISIKPSSGMYLMKQDMMGAATLLCTLKIIVTLGLPINISSVFPLVENMPSGSATKPGDVFTSMSGKTVEVDNTDAEGRLILADALTFAQKDNPKYLFDAATLTGAMVISLGTVYSGYFTTDDSLSNLIDKSGKEANDLFWRMPLSAFYRKDLKSHVADINNMGGREAGSCKAAEFLKEFVNTKETKWVHFDIAGTMDKSYISEMYGKEATGKPVRGFFSLIEHLSRNE